MEKIDHIVQDFLPNNPNKIFYPIDKEGKREKLKSHLGVVDEWAALNN